MARIVFSNYERNLAPAWQGDFSDREHVLPGGAVVDASLFTANGEGKKFIASGSLVSRATKDAKFGPFNKTHADIYLVLHDVTDAAVNPEVELYRHGGLVKVNHLPAASQATDPLAEIVKRYETVYGAQAAE